METKIIGKVAAPVEPKRADFDSLSDFNVAMDEYNKELAEFKAEQKEAEALRAKAAAGDHGPVDAGPGAGSLKYDDGNIRVIK